MQDQIAAIQSILGKPKPTRRRRVSKPVVKEKVSRKSPCTKRQYDKFVKDSGRCVYESHKECSELTLEDILNDSVESLLICFREECGRWIDVLWYVTEKLGVDKKYALDSLNDNVHSAATSWKK